LLPCFPCVQYGEVVSQGARIPFSPFFPSFNFVLSFKDESAAPGESAGLLVPFFFFDSVFALVEPCRDRCFPRIRGRAPCHSGAPFFGRGIFCLPNFLELDSRVFLRRRPTFLPSFRSMLAFFSSFFLTVRFFKRPTGISLLSPVFLQLTGRKRRRPRRRFPLFSRRLDVLPCRLAHF